MPSPSIQTEAIADSETYQALLARAQRRTGAVAPQIIVRHVISVTQGGDWPVQRDAIDAVLRRCASAHADEIQIIGRPRGRALGLYVTRRRGSRARPYRTLLRGIEPLDGSCECADFLRNSLGLCKHLVAVLERVVSNRRRGEVERESPPELAPLRWDPIRPLTGAGDWMARIHWVDGAPDRHLRRWLRPGQGHGRTVAVPGAPERRLALVDRLLTLASENVEPALHALLRGERARLSHQIEAASTRKHLHRALHTLKQSLYRYQRDGVERFFERGRLLLADDMGLGKTAQAIAACHALWHTGRVRRGLLVVPAALKPQWLREWQFFTDAPAVVIEGTPDQRRAVFEACGRGFLLGNYEQLIRDIDVVREWIPDIVVLDEAQRIKNWATKTALTVKRLDPPYRLVLTGTPMENRLDELASIVEWVDDLALEPKWRLTAWHTTTPAEGKAEIAGARNLDTLRTRLATCMVRRVRQAVLSQLPPRTDTRIPIEMTAEQMDEHDALNVPIAQILGRAKRRSLAQPEFLRLMTLLTTQRIIANGLAQLRFEQIWRDVSRIERPTDATLRGLATPKLVELRELIGQLALAQGRKVVVFSQWRRMLRLAHWATRDLLTRERVRAAFFTGEEGQKRRTQNIVDFHDDPACRVLFATDAGGVGLNLQRAASACINVELPWNPAVLEQRIGRIYRLGQRRPIDVYNLVSEPGIESRIADLVGSKQAFFTGLFDGTTDEVAFERSGTFLSRIERIVTGMVPSAPDRVQDGAVSDDDGAEREIEAVVAAGDESGDAAGAAATGAEPALSPTDIQRLVSGLTVQRTDRGGLVIEAPPETASTLAALFSGMAQLLQAAAIPRAAKRRPSAPPRRK